MNILKQFTNNQDYFIKTIDNIRIIIYNIIRNQKITTIYKKVGKYIMKGKKNMNTKQLNSYLEALKIIAQNATDKTDIIKAIEQLQTKLNE